MTVEVSSQAVVAAEQFPSRLRQAVLEELAARELVDADALAEQMGILPIAADGLLRRHEWSVETSIWVITALGLPLGLSVTRAL